MSASKQLSEASRVVNDFALEKTPMTDKSSKFLDKFSKAEDRRLDKIAKDAQAFLKSNQEKQLNQSTSGATTASGQKPLGVKGMNKSVMSSASSSYSRASKADSHSSIQQKINRMSKK